MCCYSSQRRHLSGEMRPVDIAIVSINAQSLEILCGMIIL